MTCGDNSAIAQNFKGKIQIKSNTDLYKIKRQDKLASSADNNHWKKYWCKKNSTVFNPTT